MIEIEQYSEEYIKKALIFYNAFLNGEISEQIKEGLRK